MLPYTHFPPQFPIKKARLGQSGLAAMKLTPAASGFPWQLVAQAFQPVRPHRRDACATGSCRVGTAHQIREFLMAGNARPTLAVPRPRPRSVMAAAGIASALALLEPPKAPAWCASRNTAGDCRTSSKSRDAEPCDNFPRNRHTPPVSSNDDANPFWENKCAKAGGLYHLP